MQPKHERLTTVAGFGIDLTPEPFDKTTNESSYVWQKVDESVSRQRPNGQREEKMIDGDVVLALLQYRNDHDAC